jgi:putative transposase
MKRYCPPQAIVRDKLRSYGAAMREIGILDRQNTEQYANNRADNSHRPFRRKERGMTRFRRTSTIQKFTSTHASVYNHFNQQRHLGSRIRFEAMCNVSLIQWRELVVPET